MTTRQQKRAKRSQLIHQLQRLEIQHQRVSGADFIISQCEGCEICTKIRAIGEQLAPSNVDVCTDAGLTPTSYQDMRMKGMSDKEIAVTLMVSSASVKNWKSKHNISIKRKRPMFDVPIERYTNLRDQGLTNQEIRKEFNCSIRTLDRWIARNNLNDKAVKQ